MRTGGRRSRQRSGRRRRRRGRRGILGRENKHLLGHTALRITRDEKEKRNGGGVDAGLGGSGD